MADLYGYSIGSTIKAIKLFGALEDRGHSVQLHWLVKQDAARVSNESGGSGKGRIFHSLVRRLLFTPQNILKNIPQFMREVRILKSNRGDVLIARLDAFRISALWVARLYQLPLIIEADGASSYEWLTFNNGPHLWAGVLLWCEKHVLSHARSVFTQSQEAKDYFVHRHGIPPEKIAVITNGADDIIDDDAAKQAALRRHYGISQNAKVVGFLGSMHHWHGVADVPQLIERVLSEFNDALFLFVGNGGALEKELRLSLLSKYPGRVIFTGHVDNDAVPAYVRLFTIAIAPYPKIDLFYFSPMKLFEYMAAGKPVIASRSGQLCEALQDGKSGILYEPGNILELQAKLIQLLKDKPRQEKLGAAARAAFLRNYTWSRKAEELEAVLMRCLRDKTEI